MERDTYSSLVETPTETAADVGVSFCDIFRSTIASAVTDQADVTLGKVALSTAIGFGLARLPSGGLAKDIVRTGLAAGGVTLITDAISNGCTVADALSNSAGRGYINHEDAKSLRENGVQFACDLLLNTGGGIAGNAFGRRVFGTRAFSPLSNTQTGSESKALRITERPTVPDEAARLNTRPEAVFLTGASGARAEVRATVPSLASSLPAEIAPVDFGGRAKLLPPAHPFDLDLANLRKLESIARAGTACIFQESPFSEFQIGGKPNLTGHLGGSAFYIGSGRFITNTHTITTYNYSYDVHLWAPNGKVVPARLERTFADADLAVLKLNNAADAKSFKPIALGDTRSILKNGHKPEVFAFGFPEANQTYGSRTPQLMVATGRIDGTANLIKSNNINGGGPTESFSWFGEPRGLTDGVMTARVTSGFSGGPVLDRQGRLLGVTWGSNVPRQTPTSGEAIQHAFAGRTWVAPTPPPVDAQRSYFIPAEIVKHVTGVKQSPGILNFYELGADKFKPLNSRLVAFLSKKTAS